MRGLIIKSIKKYLNKRKDSKLKKQRNKVFSQKVKELNRISNKKMRKKSHLYQRAQNLLAKN